MVLENIHTPPPHRGSQNFLGVGESKRDKFPKGKRVHKELFIPEGLKCDRINTYVFFPIDSGNKEKRKVLSMERDVGFLLIYFLLLFRRQTTHTALRHTSKYHVWRWVKQNGQQEKYRIFRCISRPFMPTKSVQKFDVNLYTDQKSRVNWFIQKVGIHSLNTLFRVKKST